MTTSRRKTVAQRIKFLALTSTALAAMPVAALATGLPGAGVIAVGSVTSDNGTSAGGAAGSLITGLNGPTTLSTDGATDVVVWGANGAVDGVTKAQALAALSAEGASVFGNVPGFNIAAGNKITVSGGGALLNVDASGNPSTIAGTLTSTDTNLFVANANGIVVAGGATVSAPIVGLIGADVTSDETKFGTTGSDIGYGSSGGSVTVAGTVTGDELIAGAGTVNVTGAANTSLAVFGGLGGVVSPDGFVADIGDIGTETPVAANHAYAATNVSLTNQTPQLVFTDGDIALAGNSALPVLTAWTGTLSNSGTLTLPGDGYIGGLESEFENPWVTGTQGDVAYAPVGAFSNSGTVLNVQDIYANGVTNTGTLYTGIDSSGDPYGLSVFSDDGDISLGGKVSATSAITAVGSATLEAYAGNVALSAPLTTANGLYVGSVFKGNVSITGAETSGEEYVTAQNGDISVSGAQTVTGNSDDLDLGFTAAAYSPSPASGAVSITAPVTVTDTNPDGSYYALEYLVGGNSVDIEAAQTVSNSNFTTTEQPDADIYVNKKGGDVTVGSAGSVTAGDVYIGYSAEGEDDDDFFDEYYTPDYRANVLVDGAVTATNTGNTDSDDSDSEEDQADFYTAVGGISIYATSIGASSTGDLTARQFNVDYTGNFNKVAADQSATSFWLNGVPLTSAGDDPTLNLYESGSGAQYTNVTVDGDITVNATSSTTSFTPGAFLSGGESAGTNLGNAGSHVVVTSTGNIVIGGSSAFSGNGSGGGTGASEAATGLYPYLGASDVGSFWTPGYLYFANVNSTTPTALNPSGKITSTGNVYNDYLIPVSGSEGIFFGTDNLTLNGSAFTNENSWVNFATPAEVSDYANVVYTVQSSGIYTNTLNVAPDASAANLRSFP